MLVDGRLGVPMTGQRIDAVTCDVQRGGPLLAHRSGQLCATGSRCHVQRYSHVSVTRDVLCQPLACGGVVRSDSHSQARRVCVVLGAVSITGALVVSDGQLRARTCPTGLSQRAARAPRLECLDDAPHVRRVVRLDCGLGLRLTHARPPLELRYVDLRHVGPGLAGRHPHLVALDRRLDGC